MGTDAFVEPLRCSCARLPLNPKREFPFVISASFGQDRFDLAKLFPSQNPCFLQCFGCAIEPRISNHTVANRTKQTPRNAAKQCCLLSKSSFPHCGKICREGLEARAKTAQESEARSQGPCRPSIAPCKPGFKVHTSPLGTSEMTSIFWRPTRLHGFSLPIARLPASASKFCYHSRLNTIFPKCFPASS